MKDVLSQKLQQAVDKGSLPPFIFNSFLEYRQEWKLQHEREDEEGELSWSKKGIVRILIKLNKQNEDVIQLRLDFSQKTPEVK